MDNTTDVDPTPEDGVDDDLDAQQAKIADQLAELSMVEEAPSGFKIRNDPFEAGDVDFSSGNWLLRLLQVQAWLHPDSEIELKTAEADARGAARAFFEAIGAPDPGTCLQDRREVVSLTQPGADYLGARLDTAVSLQQAFHESLETLTNKQATTQWEELWDEREDTVTAVEPIKAKSDIWRISDFSGKAARGLLNLSPSYQRGDVWPTRDAQKLVESILRGIPLPSIILLKPKSRSRVANYEVVDGKQRLTSILRFIGRHPRAIERVAKADAEHPGAKLKEHFSKDYKKFRRLWKTLFGEALSDKREAEFYFPFRLAQNSPAFTGSLSSLAGKYYCQIGDDQIDVGEGQETVSNVFEGSSDYKIPLIEYLDASPKQIHEVFHLYNRQGKHLNAEEIRNALFHEVALVRLVLVASGDNSAVDLLARYLEPDDHRFIKEIGECLDNYKFGNARYRKTKMLSWLFGLLFQRSDEDGNLNVRSTAKQIDTLLESIRDNSAHQLADETVLIGLVRDTHRCLEAHSSSDCWESRFKDDDKGSKWQELQLVASLVGVFLIGVVEESPAAVLERHRDEIREFLRGHRRPDKTQNRTQWAFIGEVALGIVAIAGVDEQLLEAQLLKRYGVNCLPTLRAAKAVYKPRSGD